MEFRRLLAKDANPEGLWEIIHLYRGYGWFKDISGWQVESEYCEMVGLVANLRPRVVLEIGTAKGATLLAWSRIASELVISVDLPGGIHGGGYPKGKEKLYRKFAIGRPGVEVMTFREDSHSLDTCERVKKVLAGRTIDFLFIDGDHTYKGVSCDFELWRPLVTPGGYVAFHDILQHSEVPDCEVDRFWAEVKKQYPRHLEIVNDVNQGWGGIGVLELRRQTV